MKECNLQRKSIFEKTTFNSRLSWDKLDKLRKEEGLQFAFWLKASSGEVRWLVSSCHIRVHETPHSLLRGQVNTHYKALSKTIQEYIHLKTAM